MLACVTQHHGVYGTRQTECNKRAAAILISTVYRAPRLFLCVCRTLDAIPESAPSCKTPQSKDCGAFPVKMLHVSPNVARLAKIAARLAKSAAIHIPALPAQNQRQTIEV